MSWLPDRNRPDNQILLVCKQVARIGNFTEPEFVGKFIYKSLSISKSRKAKMNFYILTHFTVQLTTFMPQL